jgi:hypothetical protein
MHKLTRLAGVAILATAALLLTACGMPSTIAMKTTLNVTAKGSVNLADFAISTDASSDATDPYYFGAVPQGSPRVIPAGSNGKATIDLAFTYDGGNWNVNGSYKDGAVQFKFKGLALELFAGCNFFSNCSSIRNATNNAFSQVQNNRLTAKGSTCVPVVSHYESTNRSMPGTGWVMFEVCDGLVQGATGVQAFGYYSGPDYVKVYSPFVGSGDQEPFAYYLSGGTLGSRENGGTSISVTSVNFTPSYSPTPIYPSPTGSQPAPPSLIR